MTTPFDRNKLRTLAAERVGDPRRDQVGSELSVAELVRTMREVEQAAVESYERNELSQDFAMGMWTAFAAVRYDFGVQDERYTHRRP